jgi:hypothetical protein
LVLVELLPPLIRDTGDDGGDEQVELHTANLIATLWENISCGNNQ